MTEPSVTRQYPRVQTEHIISIKPLESSGEAETLTTSKVVGLGGLMFESERRRRNGQILELSLLAGRDLIKVNVKVVWCRKASPGHWQVGVAFQDITEDEQVKLLDFLLRRVYLEEEIAE
jgi:hypothetical protein